MKTKIKRHSRSVISVLLAVCMLVSCMTVGLIASDAANVDSETVGLDSGDGIHLGIGTTTTTWHSMGSNAYEFTLAATTTIYYTFSVGGGNFGKGNQGTPGADSEESWTWYAIKGDNTQYSTSLPAGTYKFKIKGYQGNNTNTLEYQFWAVSSGGGGDEPGGDATEVTDADLKAILKGTKAQFYFAHEGSNNGRFLYDDSSNKIASGDFTLFTKCKAGYATVSATNYVPTGTYYISDWEGWQGRQIPDTINAGYLYCMINKDASPNPTFHSAGHLDNSTDATVTWNTSSATVKYGATSSSISATKSGSTPYAALGSVKYYYEDDNKIYEFNPASLPNLDPGTYNVYAAASDGKIYLAAGSTGTLTVRHPLASSLSISADPTEHSTPNATSTITVTATGIASGVTNLTYRIYNRSDNEVAGSVEVTNGADSVSFNVTSDDRVKSYYASVFATDDPSHALYDEVWTSTDATITNSEDQYIPRYTVTFSSNNNSYGTVTAKKADGTALTSGQTVKEGTSVTFTATPTAGNEFVEWDNFDTKATSVTRVIRAATTVQGKFGPKGYKLLAGDSDTTNMRELSNGTYISKALTSNNWFQIVENSTSRKSVGSSNPQQLNTDGTKVTVTWTDGTTWGGNAYSKDSGTHYVVYDPATNQIWLTSDQDDLYDVEIYAKDGTIRDDYSTSSAYGDTTISMVSPNNFSDLSTGYAYSNDSYRVNQVNGTGRAEYLKIPANNVRNGVTIKIATQTTPEKVAEGYYVKGFVVSGHEKSYSVLWQEFGSDKAELSSYDDRDWIHSGYNEFELTIEGYPDKKIEITPIYFKRETTSGDNVRFYVEGFAGTVAQEWKDTLSVDVYNTSDQHIYGDYPGQLMINYNGRYLMDIPRTNLKGITMNNYVWDKVHSHIFYGDSTSDNYQTYDFNDFIYINQRLTTAGHDEDIVFSFRERVDGDHATKATSQLGTSTYYVDSTIYDGSSVPGKYSNGTVHASDYRNGYETIDPNDSIYQWEDLTNLYKDRVDIFGDMVDTKDTNGNPTNTKANYNPVRIVSNGYDYSKTGNYATAWALYEPVDASGNFVAEGAYHHYQLIEIGGGQGNSSHDSSSYFVNPAFDNKLRLKYDHDYCVRNGDTSHFIYDLAKMPTLISYEYQVEDGHSNLNLEGDTGNGEVGKRSDGRWYVTSSDKLLTAHTVIEYAEKDDKDKYVRDFYQGSGVDYTSETGFDPSKHTGMATGIQAYFDNDDSGSAEGTSYSNTSGYTRAYAKSDGEHVFKLKTVGDANGDYIFKGWYLYVNGKYTFVSDDPEYESEATANDVYVARYYKVTSGTLNISHLLSSDSKGTAKCEVKAEVLGTDGTTVEDSTSYPYTEGALRITNKHIRKSTDGNSKYIRITLKTSSITGYFDEFEKNINDAVSALTGSDNLGIGATVTIDTSGNDKTATITFPIDSLFNSDGNQTTKSLPFYSKIGTYKYSLHFDFQGYRNLYGNLGYDVAETEFTAKELEDYFVLSDSVKDTNNDTVTAYTFKDDDARNAFINLKAPYENTFMETVKWQTDMYGQEHPEGMTATYSSSNHKWSFVVKLKKTDDRFAFVKLRFPYAVKNYDPDKHAPQTSTITIDDKSVEAVAKLTNNEYVEFGGRSTTTTNYRTGYGANYFISGSYVTAANKVWNTTENRWEYFDYWKVENVGDSKTGSAEYTRCYYPEFNLSLYQDSILTPIYTTRAEGMTPSQRAAADDNARIDTYSTGGRATITMMENSRMQWTGGRAGNTLSGTYVNGGDRIYTDFLVSYTYGDKQLNTDTTGMKGGIVIETVRDLDSNDDGYYTKDQSEYKTTDDSSINKANIKAFIEGGANAALLKTEFNVTTLDNKNRKNQYYSLPNISQTTHDPTERKNKLYRAYSYLKDSSGTVLLISDPIYFTIYDIASIENMSAGAEYGGVS